jgi:hypothetical protein
VAGAGRVQALNAGRSAAGHPVAQAVQNKVNLLGQPVMALGIRNLPLPDQEFVENGEGSLSTVCPLSCPCWAAAASAARGLPHDES